MHFSSHLSVQNHNILNTRDFIGKGCPGGEQVGEGTQEDHSDTWLAVWGFRGMGLVSGLSLGNPSDSWAFLVVHPLLSQDECQARRILGGGRTCGVLLLTFPELFRLVEAC